MAWKLGLAANVAVAGGYFTIATLILGGLLRSGQLRTNRLGAATALIFFTCGTGHLIHAEHLALADAGASARASYDWHLAAWDGITAVVASVYLSLRRHYGMLLRRPDLFENIPRAEAERALRAAEEQFRTAFEGAPIGMALVALDGRFLRVNGALSAIVGHSAEALARMTFHEITHPEDLEDYLEHLQRLLAGELASYDMEKRYVHADGHHVWVALHAALVRSEEGQPLHLVAQMQDISARKRTERELSRYHALVQAADDAVYATDLHGTIVTWNPGAQRLYGFSATEAIGRSLDIIMPPDLPHERHTILDLARSGHEPRGWETHRRRRDGTRVDVWITLSPVRDPDGEAVGAVAVARDISERLAAQRIQHAQEQALRDAEERFRTAFDQAPIGVALVDLASGRIVRANHALGALTGQAAGELSERPLDELVDRREREGVADALTCLARTSRPVRLEQRLARAGDEDASVVLCASAVAESAHAIVHVLEISERKRFEERLQHLADHDALTGLLNRGGLEQELDRILAHARRYRRSGAFLTLDLDGFKYVNDTLGHPVGDALIRRVGQLLRGCLRDTDTLARLGGDEFAIVLPDADERAARAVAGKVLAAIGQGAVVSGAEQGPARVTTSIGIAVFAGAEDLAVEDLLMEADIALYDAKDAGRNTARVFRAEERRTERLSVRTAWLERLRAGLAEDRFRLLAQPVLPMGAGGIDRYELLLRFQDDSGDLVPPGSFLSIAERFDLIAAIDRWVLGQAVALLHAEHASGRSLSLSVNLSGRTLVDPTLPDHLVELLARHPVPAGSLIVEVTETAAIVNIEQARVFVERLHALGGLFALDDFGTGFASFYYLKHLPFDLLKIDGEFVRNLPGSATDRLVIRALVDIARGLCTKTVAEFVSDDETVELLRELGVDYGQGYHLARPRPVNEVLPEAAAYLGG